MAKDYAKATTTKKKSGATSIPPDNHPPTPSKLFMLIVVTAVIGLVYGLYYLSIQPEPLKKPDTEATTPPPAPIATEEKPTKEQTYDFYRMLPKSEVTTSPVDAYKPDPAKAKIKHDYMLQTGSFRNASDAERQKANIGFQGLRAEIKQVSGKGNSTWYRVEVGPYKSRSKMNAAIDKLVAINIQPLVKQLPQK